MFFTNNKTLIYIKRNTLEFFHGEEKLELVIPVAILQNLEIVDSENFEKLLRDFLLELKFKKQKTLIVLSDEVFFQKEVVSKDEKDLEIKYQTFKDSLPISLDKLVNKKIIIGEKVLFFAANKKLYQVIKAVLEEESWEVNSVVPITLFREKLDLEDGELTTSSSSKILSSKDLIKLSDFLSETQEVIKKGSKFKLILFLILGFLLFSIITILLGMRLNLISIPGFSTKDNSQKPIKEEVKNIPSVPPEASESANIEEYLGIQILNGSGVAGQAAKVSSLLFESGYKNIEVGNADTVGTKTAVSFSDYVKEKDKEEITNKLEEFFAEVEEQEYSEDSEFDVLITTGEEIIE